MKPSEMKVGALIRWTGRVSKGYGPDGMIINKIAVADGEFFYVVHWFDRGDGAALAEYPEEMITKYSEPLTLDNMNEPVNWA